MKSLPMKPEDHIAVAICWRQMGEIFARGHDFESMLEAQNNAKWHEVAAERLERFLTKELSK